jgi:hypothetical protein
MQNNRSWINREAIRLHESIIVAFMEYPECLLNWSCAQTGALIGRYRGNRKIFVSLLKKK